MRPRSKKSLLFAVCCICLLLGYATYVKAFGAGDGTLLKRPPEETCHACHKTDRNSPGDPDAIRNHNSSSTGSSKWGGSWGVAGGKYGEFLCTTCHTAHDTSNIYLIRQTIKTADGTNWATSGTSNVNVIFKKKASSDYPNPGVADGVMGSGAAGTTDVCQVCHSLTSHFRWNGSGSDQTHSNVGGASGLDCSVCHSHKSAFAHGGGSGTGCQNCHGHDEDWPVVPGFSWHGTTKSHATHTQNDARDLKGPFLQCGGCHDTNNLPRFKDGQDKAGTTVCNPCHSPGGTYDGVNDPVVGAKANWKTGAYGSDKVTLRAGKEKWCATCHDEVPSVIQGVYAPNVIGDENAYTPYGRGYGYYTTGHGLAQGTYPASGAPAANKGCPDCHDSTIAHIDGAARTYLAASNNYQAGYRLKSIGGGLPMKIPRSSMGVDDFPLCFSCHQSSPYLVQTDMTTNFRNGTSGVNAHWYHLMSARPANDWDSDWDGATGDSRISCPACHDVHGSPSPQMIRHGELISTPGTTDKVPSIDFQYTPADIYPTLAESTGGTTRFVAGGAGTITKTGVCNMCHNESYTYTRSYSDMYPPRIIFVYGKVGSNVLKVTFSEAVYSNPGASGDLTAADFTLTDTDNGRTIVNVIHAAGDTLATVILSAALDASSDIGTDTLSAASAASIYDAAGNPMGTAPVTISGDSGSPSISRLDPANGAIDVALNKDLTFSLSDSGIGIDWTTFSIQLSGNLGYAKTYTGTDTAIVSKTGTPSSYKVAVDPDVFFGSGEVITVTVNVRDLAGNSLMPPAWSFTAASVAIWETPDSVYDSLQLSGAGNLIDENLATGNDFTPLGPDHYATFKLESSGNLYGVTHVRLYGGPSVTSTWRIYVSTDGATFTQVGSVSVGGASQWYEYAFPSAKAARYIRINDWHPGPESANAAFEFQFKGTPVVEMGPNKAVCATGGAPFTTIQAAIDYLGTLNSDIITVCDGTYPENIIFNGKNITVKSQNGAASTRIIGASTTTDQAVVRFQNSETSTAVLDGFTIDNQVTPALAGSRGIYISGASPAIKNCIVNDNLASTGAGIYVSTGSPTITGSTISNNNASGNGGGIYITGASSVTITDTTIESNTTSSTGYGGGVFANSGTLTIRRCTIKGNWSGREGGGIHSRATAGIIENTIISGNKAASASAKGGGIWDYNGLQNITNSTIAGNASQDGGGIFCNAAGSTITNVIIWGNSGVSQINGCTVNYSDVQGGYAGTGNINSDPIFVDDKTGSAKPNVLGNYRIQSGSPCKDAIAPENYTGPADDIDGQSRPYPVGGSYDMGADEYVP